LRAPNFQFLKTLYLHFAIFIVIDIKYASKFIILGNNKDSQN